MFADEHYIPTTCHIQKKAVILCISDKKKKARSFIQKSRCGSRNLHCIDFFFQTNEKCNFHTEMWKCAKQYSEIYH